MVLYGTWSESLVKKVFVCYLNRCDGECSLFWGCSNDPLTCEIQQIFEQCFNPFNSGYRLPPCPVFRACVGGPVVLPAACTRTIECLKEELILEPECVEVHECFLNSSKMGECYDTFQCLEDQVEPKCEYITTPAPDVDLAAQDAVIKDCGTYETLLEVAPDVAHLRSQPLSLLIIKGPSEYQNKNFLFSSTRLVLKFICVVLSWKRCQKFKWASSVKTSSDEN